MVIVGNVLLVLSKGPSEDSTEKAQFGMTGICHSTKNFLESGNSMLLFTVSRVFFVTLLS